MADDDRKKLLEVLEWIKGKDDDVDRYQGQPAAKTKWYIVSTKWLNRWKRINKLTDDVDETEMDEDLGEIDSEDIISHECKGKFKKNYVLKGDLKIGRDFEILPKKAWKFLAKKYRYKQKIIRKSIQSTANTTQIEITLFSLNILLVLDKELKTENPEVFFVSRKEKLNPLISQLEKDAVPNYSYNSKLWKLNPETSPKDLAELIKNANGTSIVFPGTLLEGSQSTIDSFEITPTDILVFESQTTYSMASSNNFFKEKDKEFCEFCRRYTFGGRRCQCGKYYYCNDHCEERDRNFHYCRIVSKIYTKTSLSCMGKVGLQNLGNTCYMNSGLQCLSNTYELTKYILDDTYINDINEGNILGSDKNELIREYAALVKEMWYGSSHHVSPWGIKRAFGDFARQFIGFHQQDSQEMLGFLIDGIHEDLNRIKTKPYVTDPDPNGLTEEQFAQKFWDSHKLRNDSIISDLMHGQYRSEVECPTCKKISVTFDPFLMLTLPIPEKSLKMIEVIYMNGKEAIRAKVLVNKGSNVGTVIEKACEIFGLRPSDVIAAETNMGSLKGIVSESSKASKRSPLMLYRKFDDDDLETGCDSEEHHKKSSLYSVLFCDFRRKTYGYGGHLTGQPYLFKVKNNVRLKDFYKQIFDFIIALKGEPINDTDELFKEKFPTFFSSRYGDNYFNLKVHNPYQYPCSICERISCAGCPIPFEDIKLSHYLKKCKEPNLRVSVIFSESMRDTSFFAETRNHESYFNTYNPMKIQESVDISECFQLFSCREQLDQENTVYCSNCKEHKQGFKKMDIFRLPKILIIHLKRFKQKNHSSSKNNKLVEFPIEGLNMGLYCHTCQGIYDLYAVSNHYGTLEGGHYTAYAKSQDGIWRDFDDSSVSVVSNAKETIVASSAYVLFYQLRE
ncbi:hypothetical protein SteCoe_30655 [Stentor coeruleus]|uniref:Ubiquitin carboxyl-terminal hydrolase n=1 Tax=Stentor coeruleus TaxID=5963 RepID=A0A1R2B3I6_9CILI|nr:hypothetical protein SteCoe_30655 [Stentor coeruleus]